jgi:hypothetical protein
MDNRRKEHSDRFDLAVGAIRLLLVLSVLLYLADRKAGFEILQGIKILALLSLPVAAAYMVTFLVMRASRENGDNDPATPAGSDRLPTS